MLNYFAKCNPSASWPFGGNQCWWFADLVNFGFLVYVLFFSFSDADPELGLQVILSCFNNGSNSPRSIASHAQLYVCRDTEALHRTVWYLRMDAHQQLTLWHAVMCWVVWQYASERGLYTPYTIFNIGKGGEPNSKWQHLGKSKDILNTTLHQGSEKEDEEDTMPCRETQTHCQHHPGTKALNCIKHLARCLPTTHCRPPLKQLRNWQLPCYFDKLKNG